MSSKTKTIIAGVFFSILLLAGAMIAVLIAFRQNTLNPVAPTVPQITPHAEGPATPACTLTFNVAAPQNVACDSLDVLFGNSPLVVTASVSGHTTNGGSVVSYKFDFGDGTSPITQSSPTLSHTFSSTGSFTVKGYVIDDKKNADGGSGNCIKTLTVTPQGVVCDNLTLDHASGTAPLTVNSTLTGHTLGGGSIVNYKFDFGDGTTPLGQSTGTIAHTFTSEGNFTIKGSVVDNLGTIAGGSGSCLQTVTVTNHVVYKYKKCEPGLGGSNVCKEEDCVPNSTPCSGLTSCQSDSDCQPKYQHKVCLGTSCSLVDCSPPTVRCTDSCASDANCVSVPPSPSQPLPPPPPLAVTPPPAQTPTHQECRNRTCVVVTGAGTNTCTSDVTCQPAATPPPIPKSGNTAATIGGIVLGVGAVVVGLLILL